jgi:hypothetical protein
MRAISPNGRYSLQLIESPVKRGTDAAGTIVEYSDTKPVIAHFEKLGLTDEEQIAALEHFSFSGLPDGVNPLSTVSVWDSEGQALAHDWTPEFLARVDKRLEYLATMHPANVLVVKPQPKPAPWPTYDDADPKEVFETMRVTGIAPEPVRLYELENKNRPEVTEVLENVGFGLLSLQDVIDSYSDVGNEVDADDPGEAPEDAAEAPPAGDTAEYPFMSSPGRWRLSDGSTFQGKKIEAIAAQAQVATAGGEQIVIEV